MREFLNQGDIDISGTIIYKSPNNVKSKVKAIRINNPSAYIITVKRYDYVLKSLINMYTFDLSAGDTIEDSFEYSLDGNDYILVTSNITGTTFIVAGEEYI